LEAHLGPLSRVAKRIRQERRDVVSNLTWQTKLSMGFGEESLDVV